MHPTRPDIHEELRHLQRGVQAALGLVIGEAESVAITPLDPDQMESLDTVRLEAERALVLVERLAALAELIVSGQGEGAAGLIGADDAPPKAEGPAQAVPGSDGGERERAPAHSPATVSEIGPRRVLLVEDNAINRRVIARLLERMGHEVTAVADGLGAVEAASDGAFDVIFMDIQLPGMDGLTAIRKIREQRTGSQRPWIVALTASVLPEDREASFEAGADDHVGKPARSEDLQAAIAGAPGRRVRAA